MPVSTTMLAPTGTPTAYQSLLSCSNCQECGNRVVVGERTAIYWPVQLDKDLLQTISNLFPNWFKDCNLNDLSRMSEDSRNIGMAGSSGEGSSGSFIPLSPPKCEVDDSPLQGNTLNKNKESLKVKLMLRRPREDLVNRGVIPPMNTPLAFYEQRQRLDMAKKHDILKHKMQRRPLREELVRQHILEDSLGNIDPSLVEKQKQLKRARIADTISDHLSQRPGPLELVKANILHTTEDLERAVKEGQLMFKSTCEGEPRKHPSLYIPFDDESSSEGGMSPDQIEASSGRVSIERTLTQGPQLKSQSILPSPTTVFSSGATILHTTPATLSAAIVASSFVPTAILSSNASIEVPPSPSFTSNTSSLSPLSSLASPQQTFLPSPQTPLTQTLLVTQTPLPHALTTPPQQNSAPGKDPTKSRKKSKGKAQSKARTIKFHEYKGPPSAVRRDHSLSTETSYDILLQQQQLFLQCQLELKQKYTQIILPASLKTSSGDLNSGVTLSSVLALASTPPLTPSSRSATPVVISPPGSTLIAPAPPSQSSTPPAPPPPQSPELAYKLQKIEDLKVSDLKVELKRRNLPVSGSKPQLVERLKFHTKTFGVSNNKYMYNLSNNSPSTSTVDGNSNDINKTNNNSISNNNNNSNYNKLAVSGNSDSSSSQSLICDNQSDNYNDIKLAQISKLGSNFTARSSLDLSDHSSMAGLFDSSVEMKDDGVYSPAYSQISTRPSSVAPMDVDFDSALDVPDLKPLTPLNLHTLASFVEQREGGSINTPPPPPPPPPPVPSTSVSLVNPHLNKVWTNNNPQVSSPYHVPKFNDSPVTGYVSVTGNDSLEHQEGIDHLKRKIDDLQRELLSTQKRLELQQKQTILKAKENISDSKTNQIVNMQRIENNKQVQQQQLQSHLWQLQQNLHNEQKQLQRDSKLNETIFDDLILINQGGSFQNENPSKVHQQNVDAQLRERQIPKHSQPVLFHQLSDDRLKHSVFKVGNLQLKIEDGANLPLQDPSNAQHRNQRSESLLIPNGIIINSHHRTSSLPNFPEVIVNSSLADAATRDQRICVDSRTSVNKVTRAPREGSLSRIEPDMQQGFNIKPPPNYTESMKHFKVIEQAPEKSLASIPAKSYKSQQVDDVLEILIKNGELPPSAAQDPLIPASQQKFGDLTLFMSRATTSLNKNLATIPPPPPPPPPVAQKHNYLHLNPTSNSNVVMTEGSTSGFSSLSSPSLFADLVMEGNNSGHLGMHLDLELPMFDGMELGVLDTSSQSISSEMQKPEQIKKESASTSSALPVVKMEVGDDVDVASWLDSLALPPPLPTSIPAMITSLPLWADHNISATRAVPTFLLKAPDSRTSSGISSIRSSLSSSTSSSSCGLSHNQCDPLLGSNPDQIDLFSMEDMDLRPPPAASELSWDRLDFPT